MSDTTTIHDWLVDAERLQAGDRLNIYLGEIQPPSLAEMRDALHAQYGKDTLIRIWKHGRRICIFIHPDEDARQRFDHRNAPHVIRHSGKRVEVENGFERELS